MPEDAVLLEVPVTWAELAWLERAARVSGLTVEELVRRSLPIQGTDQVPLADEVRARALWPAPSPSPQRLVARQRSGARRP